MHFELASQQSMEGRKSAAIIPRLKRSQQRSSHFGKKPAYSGFSRASPHLLAVQNEQVSRQLCEDRPFRKQGKTPIYQQQYKQNLSPIILEQKKLEMSQRNSLPQHKRAVTSHQLSFNASKQQAFTHFPTFNPKKGPVVEMGHRNMDAVCSKMTESIILSEDTLDSCSSLTDVGLPISVDQFEKIKFLGQGKFGQVHLAKHKFTGLICALKIIDKRVVREEKVEMQIAKQLRIHSKLKSLNIIDFYGFFDDQKYFYILLEYATQGSVFSKLKGKTRLEEPQILPIARGLCDGLRFMHRMGYIHRDIKPQNIVLQFGVAKICDFGWATDCDDTHLCKSYCGTPLYLSPEMVKKQFYGTSVDIWAVGLVVYELLVGRVPFSIWSEQDMNQILMKSIQFPQYIDRSDKCEQFIRKCLQKQTFIRMQLNEALRHPFLNESQPTNQSNLDYEFFESINKILTNY